MLEQHEHRLLEGLLVLFHPLENLETLNLGFLFHIIVEIHEATSDPDHEVLVLEN